MYWCAYAGLGALAVQLLNLAEIRNMPEADRPDLKDWTYWLPFGIYPAIAIFLAIAYENSGVQFNAFLAVNVGASAPLILRGLCSAVPASIPSKDIN